MIQVIVLTYNHRQFISQCIEGILSQQLEDQLLCTVIDDFSTDGTTEALKNMTNNAKRRVEVVRSNQNSSWSSKHPFFDVMRSSKAEFIAFCDGDDFWVDNEKLRKQLGIAKANPSLGLVHTDYKLLIPGQHEPELRPIASRRKSLMTETAFDMIAGNNIKHSTVLIRRSYLNMDFLSGSDRVLSKDWLMYVDILAKSKALYFDEPTTVHRIHEGGLWNGSNLEEQREMKEQVRWFCASQLEDGALKRAFKRRVAVDHLRSLAAKSRVYRAIRPMVVFLRKGQHFFGSKFFFA